MKTDSQRRNWIVDAVLFAGFLGSMLLDVTGLGMHQWLGVALVALAGYHLLAHRQWVASVTQRFFGRTGGKARRFYLVDAALLSGFLMIGLTGLLISSWLDLPLANYAAWRTVHVVVSVATSGLVVLKIGMHWRWIVTVGARKIFPAPTPALATRSAQPVAVRVGRREFVRLMSFVGASALLAGLNALRDDESSLAGEPVVLVQAPVVAIAQAASPTATPPAPAAVAKAATPTAAAKAAGSTANSAAASACVVRCSKRCSYPGRCRRYVDTNGNRKCDLGECKTA